MNWAENDALRQSILERMKSGQISLAEAQRLCRKVAPRPHEAAADEWERTREPDAEDY